MRRIQVLVALFAAVTLVSSVAEAQESPDTQGAGDAEARGIFMAGRAAFEAGHYEDALKYFNRSYQLSKRPMLLYNIGQAADRLRRDEEALAAFEGYLKQVQDAPNREAVEARIKVLRAAVDQNRKNEEARRALATVNPYSGSEPPKLVPPPPLKPAAKSAAQPEPVETAGKQEEDAARQPRDEEGGILTEWWFWTTVALVAGGVTLGVIALTSGEEQEEPLPVGTGIVVSTLELP